MSKDHLVAAVALKNIAVALKGHRMEARVFILASKGDDHTHFLHVCRGSDDPLLGPQWDMVRIGSRRFRCEHIFVNEPTFRRIECGAERLPKDMSLGCECFIERPEGWAHALANA